MIRRPSTIQFSLALAFVLAVAALAWSYRDARPLVALAFGLVGLLVVVLLALVHVLPSTEPVALVTSRRRAVEAAAHLALLGAIGACLHEPGLALAGCACRLA